MVDLLFNVLILTLLPRCLHSAPLHPSTFTIFFSKILLILEHLAEILSPSKTLHYYPGNKAFSSSAQCHFMPQTAWPVWLSGWVLTYETGG